MAARQGTALAWERCCAACGHDSAARLAAVVREPVIHRLPGEAADGGAHGLWIEAAANQEHADALQRLGIARQWAAAKVPLQGDARALGLRLRQLLVGEGRFGDLIASQLLDDLSRDAALAQLCLDQAAATGRMPVALLRPPAGECHVICQAHAGQPLEGALDQCVVSAGARQSAAELPAGPRPGGQVTGGDVERRVGVRRLSRLGGSPTPLR